jgi:hypothetical protein
MNYIYIRAWGEMMGSNNSYIRDQLATAKEDHAPGNAIYKGEDGEWHTIEEVRSGNRRQQLERTARRLQANDDPPKTRTII